MCFMCGQINANYSELESVFLCLHVLIFLLILLAFEMCSEVPEIQGLTQQPYPAGPCILTGAIK